MLITPLFAVVLSLIYIGLSFNVIRHRFGKKISIGSGDDKRVEYAVRAHANFIEYVPLALILFYFLEVITLSSFLVFYLGTALVVARVMHLLGMLNPKELLVFRQIGVIVTMGVILIACVALALRYIPISV